MKINVCNHCGLISWSEYREPDLMINIRCPKCHQNAMTKLDDDIAPIVVKLNQLGYLTRFSCSGHIEVDALGYVIADSNAYITFRETIDGYCFKMRDEPLNPDDTDTIDPYLRSLFNHLNEAEYYSVSNIVNGYEVTIYNDIELVTRKHDPLTAKRGAIRIEVVKKQGNPFETAPYEIKSAMLWAWKVLWNFIENWVIEPVTDIGYVCWDPNDCVYESLPEVVRARSRDIFTRNIRRG